MQSFFKTIGLVIALILLVALAPKLQFFFEQPGSNTLLNGPVILIDPACDVTKGDCVVSLSSTRRLVFSLQVGDGKSSTESSNTFSFTSDVVSGDTPRNLQLRIEGRDMFMGVVDKSFLQKTNAHYVVNEATLPACRLDPDMVWSLSTNIVYDNQTYKVVFSLSNSLH